MAKTTYFVFFRNREHLFQLWNAMETPPLKVIYQLPNDGLAVPFSEWVAGRDPQKVLNDTRYLSEPLGDTIDLEEGPKREWGEPVTLEALALGPWQYRDPITAAHHCGARPALVRGAQEFDPNNHALCYILGAETQAQAQKILHALTHGLTPGIKARPVRFVDTTGRYKFFWVLSRGDFFEGGYRSGVTPSLSLTVAGLAARVWWSIGEGQVFLEWPYELNTDQATLERVFQRDGLVLLSREVPQCVVIRSSPDTAPFVDLIEVANFKPALPLVTAQAESLAPEKADFHFDVDLRLAPKRPREKAEDRLKRLQREIEAKQRICEQIQNALGTDNRQPTETLEPMFLYLSEKTERLPNPLGRLLLEWADQESDLRDLRYAKLDPRSLPAGMLTETAEEVHVVTTARAVGQEEVRYHLGMRLLEYRPQLGTQVAFELLPEWAWFGLRLFVPLDESLELSPRLQPHPEAAAKLGAALFGDRPRDQWCAMLMPGLNLSVDVVLLPLRGFKPLIEAFDWQCRIALHQKTAEVLKPLLQNLPEAAAQAAGKDYADGVAAIAGQRLEEKDKELHAYLDGELKRLTEHLDNHRRELDQSRRGLRDFQLQLNASGLKMRQILAQVHQDAAKAAAQLNQVLSAVPLNAQDLENAAKALVTEVRRLGELAQVLQQVNTEYSKTFSKLPLPAE